MLYEYYKKQGYIEHPDKGNLDIVEVDFYVDTPSIPTLSKWAGNINQLLISDKQNVSLTCEQDWFSLAMSQKSLTSPYSWDVAINYKKNDTGDYREGKITIKVDSEDVGELSFVQNP